MNMKPHRLVVALFATVAIAATPLTLRANHLVDFVFPLTVDQTVPAAVIPDGEPIPFGNAVVQVNTDDNTISWNVTYQDLTGPIVPPGAHFHGPAPLGTNAGVEIFLSDGNPEEPATGALVGSAPLTDQQEADVLAGLWYINIHTQANNPGEIRGQVVNIPEPTSLALLVTGLFGACVVLRRRRK